MCKKKWMGIIMLGMFCFGLSGCGQNGQHETVYTSRELTKEVEVQAALAVAANGAGGETLTNLQKLLCSSDTQPEAFSQYLITGVL